MNLSDEDIGTAVTIMIAVLLVSSRNGVLQLAGVGYLVWRFVFRDTPIPVGS